ncbi:MAG: hypothetical protein ACOWWM_09555 [Desulfobacterales bacterium]
MKWLQYLRTVTGANAQSIDLIQEFLGYCSWPDNRYGKFMAVSGGFGESFFLLRAARMVVERNVAISGACLDDPVCRAALDHARFAYSTDFGEIAASRYFLPFIDGDYLPGEASDGLPIMVDHHCKLILFSPRPSDFDALPSHARDRMLHVQMHRPVVPFDFGLLGDLRNEVADIRRWASEGLDRLTAAGRFGCAFCAAA